MYKGITRRNFLKGVAASAATMAASGMFNVVGYAEETDTTITYPDSYTREALAEGLKMTEEEIDLTVDAIVNTLLADGDTECFYTMIAGNADKTAIQGNPGYATGCPELGVPESYYHDGPAGVTSIYETTGFPVNMSLGSTFSKDLAYAYGEQEGLDNLIIGSNFQLGTQMDVVRTGHWNRTKDTMGEDPFLTGTLGTQQVAGVQDQGVAAMIKHYAGYGTNGDTSVNVTIDEQTFHEFYVTSFEFPIRYANAASVMTTYNSIAVPGFTAENGEFTDSNDYINLDVLRDMVGFKGMICCDWGGQKEMSAFQGNTMSMPSAGNNTQENIEAAIEAGEGTFDQIVENVKDNLYAYGVAGYLYYSYSNIYYVDGEARVKRDTSRDCADATTAITLVNTYDEDYTVEFMDKANETVKEIAESGAVLLQNNNNALPLDAAADSVALIGLGASYAITGTGAERSYGVVNYIDSPAEAIEKIAGSDAKITAYAGIDEVGTTIPTEYIYTTEDGDEHGFLRTYGVVEESSGGFGFPGSASEETEEETEANNELPEYVPGPDGTGVFASSDIWAMNGLSNESIYVQEVSDTKTAYFMVKDSESGEVYDLDEVACIDETIDFTAGIHADGRRDFSNADEEDAIEAGNAITNGEAYTWTGYLEAPEDGDYSFILQSIGGTVTCTVDGQTVSSGASSRQGTQWGWDNLVSSREGMGIGTPVTMTLEAGKRYKIEITGIDMPTDLADIKDMQIRLSWIPAGKAETDYEEAVQAARDNNKVVFFMYDNTTGNSDSGSTMAWGETSDEEVTPASRTIAAEQLQLLSDIIDAANENGNQVIVVLNTASSIAFCDDTYFTDGNGWADKVDAILEMWFGGQAVGTATAALLLGVVSTRGLLPLTFLKVGTADELC
ncbi:MAG: glycoside hydrolase family 3 C-terminal domain-containing protein [Lachnospiraceae bacterium]|nr:glycoside hydrolase family 3 C-terminal domain-containing protein [Lachnospiraceae bacterium]